MTVHWTQTAIDHLDGIHAYIAMNSPGYADRIIDKITSRSIQISAFPLSGRKVPEIDIPQIREVIEGSYRIIYYIKADRIDILSVIHGAQNFPWSD